MHCCADTRGVAQAEADFCRQPRLDPHRSGDSLQERLSERLCSLLPQPKERAGQFVTLEARQRVRHGRVY